MIIIVYYISKILFLNSFRVVITNKSQKLSSTKKLFQYLLTILIFLFETFSTFTRQNRLSKIFDFRILSNLVHR